MSLTTIFETNTFSSDQIETAQKLSDLIVFLDGDAMVCGSRITCNPPPSDTDADVLVYLNNSEKLQTFMMMIADLGLECESITEHYQDKAKTFLSFRSANKINVILTVEKDFWHRHQIATRICQKMNVMNKQHRILIFQGVLYGVDYNRPDPFFPSEETLEQWQERNGLSPKSSQFEEIPF